ncbi:vacuolar protein 8 [Impatiens glandulifera]|uniref:vacuolar protein 8 n=1 Tax=Impatiens glandulifera TaxID=253017 RepID=UPI001FB15962|nr:vacuolar protein 8 [Impatiens glandulifera]
MSEEEEGGEGSSISLSTGKNGLRRAAELTTSIVSLSLSIRVFSVKWQSVRDKLEELHSGLVAAETCIPEEDPCFASEIPAIIETIEECHDLARRCLDLTYSGKLLMQSDLDIMSSKFDRHVKSLSEICTSGILRENFAIVLSKPGLSASRDDMKFYVNDLLSRFKIGGSGLKKQALIQFNEIIQEDERYIKIAIETGSFLNFLVNFLDSEEEGIQEEAAKAVSTISGFGSYRNILISCGIIGPSIRSLESGNGSGLGREMSARCLMKLTENSDNAWSVSSHGGVTVLLKISTSGEYGGELVGLACGVLKNLVGVEEIKRFMIEEGAVASFVKLLKSRDEIVLINSIDFLQSMAFGDEAVKQMIVNEGAIRSLARIFEPKSSYSIKARESALSGIANLCFTSNSTLKLLLNSGFLDHILYYLRIDPGSGAGQELAVKAACRLSETSEEAKKAMGDGGFMPELVRLLNAKSLEVRETAGEVLMGLISVQRNRKRFVQNEENVGSILEQLEGEEDLGNDNKGKRKLLLSILMSLVSSSGSARKKITSSGYMKSIEKLAEADVSDAKRIVRKLSSNRFRTMFTGIWH